MADARDVFYRERDKIYQAILNGDYPYGGAESAINSIYSTYGQGSGVSYQEAAGIINEAYSAANSGGTSATGGGTGGTSGGGTPAFKVVFQGVTYTDPEAYKNALNIAAGEELQRTKTSLKKQYDDGIISYQQMETALAQNRQQIIKQRDDNYASNAQYFANVSPDAYQSQQGNYENDVKKDYTQKNSNLDTQAGNIQRGKEDLGTNYNNQIGAAERNYQSNLDSYANNVASIQGYSGSIAAPTNQFNAQQVNNAATTNAMGNVRPVGQVGSSMPISGGAPLDASDPYGFLKNAGSKPV